ncbi:TPA: Holliday junction branch migration DNA helicase RuvB [Candidatus Nomurabacteria bacterium]|uniref:Holliday junction branch migration complex subunit RuvB n=1 Tax=Candidatus Nomurabacteria bacterium GW2011_GWF2_43_24 TaxID=1618778 RepID=A0A0G1EJV0_9BACT|nr:MAG: Holliday junction ATP-dependent DNA helicase RuvB [Parcubacteria group bacterium GW2011_GWC1_42_21]KKS58476.1 MAG: Holliday junction ATP-dependent DNA helicase RuvB [Candidatus Nomurabacteria bacterium GW2011_GWF1_42_40]KKS99381.1 MAG: Holliday junction ATP-dependent DNA helicase RuvB [Candidatus Nomurabacteria bacterium GW2011_GWA1_43_17]KKT06578.1 MAG: Holliday junction ATP-dependent DNA helicase RuvB [Candidatus Nomurabacteria bacterium GW2011_GWB1_43_19]KKT10346.1 MAG: Holliday junc
MSRKTPKETSNSNSEKSANFDDSFLDQTLRPTRWEEYIGQKHIKDNVKILLRAAEERGHIPEHVLFYGPPGLGKTTLAHLIAKETGRQMKITSGPAIEKVGDLASILTNLSPGDILFIDEIHRLNKMVEEILYPAMESGVLDIIIGKGPSARTIQLDLPPFTLIAATTRVALVSSPLRSRFSGGVFRLEFYSNEEIEKIIQRSSKLLKTELEAEALKEIAKRSRFTPRTANYFLKRCRDFAQVHKKSLDQKTVREALNMLAVDEIGLNPSDRKFLEILIEKFGGGPVGLKTIGAAMSEEEATVEEVIEPYLIQLGLLERSPRGRVATNKAYEHLGFARPEKKQEKLL